MGKRLQGAALRAKKRETEQSKEIVETAADEVEKGSVTAKTDDELFVVDTTAIVPSKKQLVKKARKATKHRQNSKKEQVQIDRLVQSHTPEELQSLARQQKPTKRPKIKGAIDPTFDLWGNDDDQKKTRSSSSSSKAASTIITPPASAVVATINTQGIAGIKPESHVQIKPRPALPDPSTIKKKSNNKTTTTTTGKVRVEVAMPGQSYNPDKIDHRRALEEALRLETQREAAERALKAPLSKGLSNETKALLLGDSDTEDEEEDNEDDDEDKISKRPEKLTRAQRNKQKRLRAEAHELQERKRQKRLQNSVEEAKSIVKKLKKEDVVKTTKKEQLTELKESSIRTKGQNVYQQVSRENPIDAPTFPVALHPANTNSTSLRTLKPKGSLVTDRMISIVDRDMAAKKALKTKRRVQGKRRKVRVRGKGYEATKEGEILG